MQLKNNSSTVHKIITSILILVFKMFNWHINLPDMIGSFASGAIAFIVAKNRTKNLSQLFKDLQGSNSEFKLVTPNLFLGPYQDYFGTILGLFWDYFGTILGPF